ncbi:MAG: integrating conjugative element protein [Acidiferrobacterales bacterium]|nr:integrating conjugative element protein [Acidiferrobacterales bacterium]
MRLNGQACRIRQLIGAISLSVLATGFEFASAEESITNYPLYYSLGGTKATSSAASVDSSLNWQRTKTNLTSGVCGSFSPSFDIQDMLSNQLNDTLTSLSAIPQTVTSALPGYILCRAKPGMCQLLQHYVVRAEKKWDISVKSCEDTMKELADGTDPFQDLMRISRVQAWQKQATVGSSATEAKRHADKADGCIEWIAGKKSGCRGSNPIWLLTDTSEAGWCLLLKQDPNCKGAAASRTTASHSHLQQLWPAPQVASQWITDVLGDYRMQSGENSSTVSGTGLLPKVEEETTQVHAQLTEVVYSGTTPTNAELEQLRSNRISLSPELITALRDLPDREFLITRLASEIALARIIEKAFLARRLLLSGLMEPNIQNSGTVSETIHKQIDILEREIERLTFEMHISKRLISDTVLSVLGAHRTLTTPGPSAEAIREMLLQ